MNLPTDILNIIKEVYQGPLIDSPKVTILRTPGEVRDMLDSLREDDSLDWLQTAPHITHSILYIPPGDSIWVIPNELIPPAYR